MDSLKLSLRGLLVYQRKSWFNMRKKKILRIFAFLAVVFFIYDYKMVYYVPTNEWYLSSSHVPHLKAWYLSDRTKFPSEIEFNPQGMPNGTKKIFWPNARDWISEILLTFSFSICPVKSCEILTHGKQYYSSSDAIVFDHAHPIPVSVTSRPRNQVWVYMNKESPIYSLVQALGTEYWRRKFNWTMTYRLDSDIVITYGAVGRANNQNLNVQSLDAIILKKKRLVTWVVSHCLVSSRRENYIRELSKYIAIDIYGKCGQSVNNTIFDDIVENHKFYIAFENSVCRDYVTEKFFRLQNRNIVLVVFGGADYSLWYPDDTYINVKDFPSPKALADRLSYLDQNDSEYKKYLVKKSQFTTLPDPAIGLCQLCSKLHQTIETKIYDNVAKWYTENMCYPPTTYLYNPLRLIH